MNTHYQDDPHHPIDPPTGWDAACSCGALLRNSQRRSAVAALTLHLERVSGGE